MASSKPPESGGAWALLVLDSTAGNLQTGRDVCHLADAAEVHGLTFRYVGEQEVGADHVHFTWLDAERDVKLVLIDDYAHDRALLAVERFPEETLDAALSWLGARVGIVDRADNELPLEMNAGNRP